MDAQSITLAMSDSSAGYDASPQRVRLAALSDFASEVAEFLAGDDREVDVNTLDVSVISGSVAIQTAPIALAPSLFRDLEHLQSGELLDRLDAKRRKVVEQWQKTARKVGGMSYRISAPFLSKEVQVTAQTDFHSDDADQWVSVERYVRGEIMDLGGIGRPNAHIKLPDGSTLKVSTTRDTLAADKINRLYKPAMLRIRAQLNVFTQELRQAQLIEFVEFAPRFDSEAFKRQTRRGAELWKDVPDASAWVDSLRGDDA